MTHPLHRRLLRLEQATGASEAVKVVTQPAGLEGEALARWRHDNLSDEGDYGLVVILEKHDGYEPAAPPLVAEPVQKPAPAMSVVLSGIDGAESPQQPRWLQLTR
jgi:hypothetical protein